MRLSIFAAALVSCVSVTGTAHAGDTSQTQANEAAARAAWAAAAKSAVFGPVTIKLLDQATLNLPAGDVFIPKKETDAILLAAGNGSDPAVYGMVLSRSRTQNWWEIVSWIGDGYVRDGDAKDWQPDALLQSLRENTARGNSERASMGLPQLDIVGWLQPPIYDAANHRLVWSILAREQGSDPNQPQTINYNTYALGRHGYFSLDMVTGIDTIAADKQAAAQLLNDLNYNQGDRYSDFDESTDEVAAYGLAALIGVVAVKKLGLLALAGVFLLKIWKIGLLALAAGASVLRRRFGLTPKTRPGPNLDGRL